MPSTETGLVSTIIPVFNRPEMIVSAVKSVLAQTYRPIEIIVVDDGSNDETVNVVMDLAAKYPEIISLSQGNAGPGVAREYGRQHARGEFIQYLDSDDQLLPDKFRLQVMALKNNPDCDVAYGKTDYRTMNSTEPRAALKLTGKVIDTMFPEFLKSRWWSTSTPLFRRSVVDKVGSWLALINEEDWEYDCRVAALGGKLACVDEFVSTTYSHEDHLSSGGTIDKVKLENRCTAREHMYQSALNSKVSIPGETMIFFSKSVFLLARHCAQQNLGDCVERMLALAIKSRGKNTLKQRVFTLLGKVFGWRNAATIVQILQ